MYRGRSSRVDGGGPWILGVNFNHHDASAAILRAGRLVAFAEEERFSRKKRASGEAPIRATKFCLSAAGISLDDISAIGLGGDYERWRVLAKIKDDGSTRPDDPERLFPTVDFPRSDLPAIYPIDHHVAHAASAFWPSGFHDAAVLVADNQGEGVSTSLFHGSPEGLRLIKNYPAPVSLGLYYQRAAEYAGLYNRTSEVGKLMGLAAYGRPTTRVPLCWRDGPAFPELTHVANDAGAEGYFQRSAQLLDYFAKNCYPYEKASAEGAMAYTSFAASVQASLEDVLLKLASELHARTGSRNLAIAGGVGLNCTANGRLAQRTSFERLFVQPVAHDGGSALGAALEVHRRLAKEPPNWTMEHAYWGPSFRDDEIRASFSAAGLVPERLADDDLVERVAGVLAEGDLVGWFRGRAEVGPRALGGRSLLGHPGKRDTWVRLNRAKGREMWRPVAPSVIAEEFPRYFDGPHASPFMIVAVQAKEEIRSLIPAVVHIDGSARPQAVTRAANPIYWSLLCAFGRRTGISMLANTSFNRDSEPIVGSPDDAIRAFRAMPEVHYLVMENFLVRK